MPRGHYWEATYDPDWDGPAETAPLATADRTPGLLKQQVVCAHGEETVQVRWKLKDGIERRFQECDFHVCVVDSYIANCTFLRCRFESSTWTNVKFSNCTFERCDFSGMTLTKCQFMKDCRFVANSASAELFRITETAISASSFIRGLKPNLAHLPPDTTTEYQKSRFVGTKEKIAKALYSATVNEADLTYFHEAYEQLVRCSLDSAVERPRYPNGPAAPLGRIHFGLRSFAPRIERAVVLCSGWLTKWGRSVVRAMCFLIVMVFVFSLIYAGLDADKTASFHDRMVNAAFAAVNISLVAGFTDYFEPTASTPARLSWVLNLVLGLYWYSLIIPVISRRTLR